MKTVKQFIQHQSDTLSYVISKENFSNLHDGFLIAGMDENGNLIYADLNGDGLINVDDKVSSDPYTLRELQRSSGKQSDKDSLHDRDKRGRNQCA